MIKFNILLNKGHAYKANHNFFLKITIPVYYWHNEIDKRNIFLKKQFNHLESFWNQVTVTTYLFMGFTSILCGNFLIIPERMLFL